MSWLKFTLHNGHPWYLKAESLMNWKGFSNDDHVIIYAKCKSIVTVEFKKDHTYTEYVQESPKDILAMLKTNTEGAKQ